MRFIALLFFNVLVLAVQPVSAQYSIVIKGGHVIDARNQLNEVMDIAIQGDQIVAVAKNIDASTARQVINAKGLYVVPGLIDMHTHNYVGTKLDQAYMNGPNAVAPDGFSFRVGVTTMVDAGSSGWRTFPEFKRNIIDRSQTRVLAFLNIVGEGMRGGPYEQDINDMDARLTAQLARTYKNIIVGIKLAHFEGADWTPTMRAVQAGKLADVPVMIDFGGNLPPLSLDTLFQKHLRSGDIYTHCYAQLPSRETIVDVSSGKVKPLATEARKKGILFDVGYGGISFSFSQAQPAIQNRFYPTTISTDLHTGSMNNAMKDMLNVMSKFLAMGMDLESVIKATTWSPAMAIKREDLGHLSIGSVADVALLQMHTGQFGFFDYTGKKITGTKKLECALTIRGGRIVYDLNGIAEPIVAGSVVRPNTSAPK